MSANEFDDALVAASYDICEGVRDDLDHYVTWIDELGARSVLDVGCGTGTLALMLAERGIPVVAVEPAGAMLDVARAKPGAEEVRWIHGDATLLPADVSVDVAVMTANVAQVFLTDEDWLATLRGVHAALVPGGHLVFETRVPERRSWERWAADAEPFSYEIEGIGEVTETFELVSVDEPLVTFRSVMRLGEGATHTAQSTLIWRSMADLERTLGEAGFAITEVRDAPDRPGAEWIVTARRD